MSIIFVGVLLLGCDEEYGMHAGLYPSLEPQYINITPEVVSFPSDATSLQSAFSVRCMNYKWEIENTIPWISVSPTSGCEDAQVSVGVHENTMGDESRVGVMFIKSDTRNGKYKKPISVSQSGAKPIIELSDSEFDLTGIEHVEKITVTSNCSWKAESNADWLSVKVNDNTISIEVTSNPSDLFRNATVVVSHSGNVSVTRHIEVRQAPSSITSSSDAIEIDNKEQTTSVVINSELPWTAVTSDSWIDLQPISGNGGKSTLQINVLANTSVNERTGNVVISIGNEQRVQIPVKQKGLYLEADTDELIFEARGGELECNISSNTIWNLSTDNDWIELSKAQGSGSDRVLVKVGATEQTTVRQGTIRLYNDDTSLSKSIAIIQKAMLFDVGTTMLNYESIASSQIVDVKNNTDWKASTDDNWITLSKDNGNLVVTVEENTEEKERIGNVEITAGTFSSTITVVQEGKYFIIDNSDLEFTAKGGTMNVAISTNGEWSAKVADNGASWVTLSAAGGTSDIDVTISVAENKNLEERATSVYFTSYGRSVCIKIEQSQARLNVDMSEVKFFAKGGTSDVITIDTDGTYEITSSVSWLNVKKTLNTFVVIADENTSNNIRYGDIVIKLGELSRILKVTQFCYGGSFIRNEYGEDTDYDSSNKSKKVFGVHHFLSDMNCNVK